METTGLNCRESFLKTALPLLQRVTVKLEAQRKILYERIQKKKKDEQGGEWLFSKNYRDKYEFVKKLFKDFRKVSADIRIDTTKLNQDEVYKTVMEKLKWYRI